MTAIREVPLGSLIGGGVGTLAGQQPVPLLLVRCAARLTAGAGLFFDIEGSPITAVYVLGLRSRLAAVVAQQVVTQRVADIHQADTRSPLTIILAAGVTWEMGPAATSLGASAISVVILAAPLTPVLQGPIPRLCCLSHLIALENGRVLTLVSHLRVTRPSPLVLSVGWLTRLVDGMLTSSGAVLFWSSCKFHLAVPVFDHPNSQRQWHGQGAVVGENRDAPLSGCHHVGQDLSTWSGR